MPMLPRVLSFAALGAAALHTALPAAAQLEIPSGRGPIAVNPVTNRIYVAEIDELVEIDAVTGAQRRVDVPALVLGSGFDKGSVLGIDPGAVADQSGMTFTVE